MSDALCAQVQSAAAENATKAQTEAASRFHWHMLLPLIAVVIAFALEVLLPNHAKLRNPDYKHFQVLLIGLFGLFALLTAAAYYEAPVRKAASSRAALSAAVLLLDGFLLLYLPQIGGSEFAGFQYGIAVIAAGLTLLAAASFINERARAVAQAPGWSAFALSLTLLFAAVKHESIAATADPFLESLQYVLIVLSVAALALGLTLLLVKSLRKALSHRALFIAALILLLGILNVVTAKFLLLPQVYFPSISRVIQVYEEEFNALFLDYLVSSFVLLCQGVGVGLLVGVLTGVLVGWNQRWNYWVNPLVRILGPIPTSTWIPLALVAFSTPRSAAIFVIAFGVWFQISILTASGIQNVKKTYYEVSSTLGASDLQNLFHIAIPDALPSIFLGLFNATCSSFAALVVAEMLGVKNGIGWYINWQKEMLAYPGVYAGLVIIAGFCYMFITIQFKLRDKLLRWQKGVIKW